MKASAFITAGVSFCLALAACSGPGTPGAKSVPPERAQVLLPNLPIPPKIAAAVPPPPSMRRPPAPQSSARRTRETSQHPPFFNGEASVGNGVYYLTFPNGNVFGYYSYLAGGNYIYHVDMGYEFYTDANDAGHGVYIYDYASDHWWYTSPQYPFPYLYDFSYNATLYYYANTGSAGHCTTNPRYFYNFGTSQIIKMPDPAVPTHVQNWTYACDTGSGYCLGNGMNRGVPASWLATHMDWNEVHATDDTTGPVLRSAGAKHVVPYVDPNISPYCGTPPSPSANDVPENGANCHGGMWNTLHTQNGSYAHAYQHRDNGNRLIVVYNGAPDLFNGEMSEPYNIGDPDVQLAFATITSGTSSWATEIFEDDAGGAYNCVTYNGRCDSGAAFASPHYGAGCGPGFVSYWCYKYGNTAVEWDTAPGRNPSLTAQQAYVNDAIALSGRAAKPVIGNNGAATNTYDAEWVNSSNVTGAEIENAWSGADAAHWTGNANAAISYHNLHKYVVELDQSDLTANPGLLTFDIASHWIVYDPVYSIQSLLFVNPAPTGSGWTNDATFPEQTVLPTSPLVATGSTVATFQKATNLYVREYAACYQSAVPIGRCAAIVNVGSATSITGLTATYGHVLVRNTAATWANGGTAQWSATVPTTIGANAGVILAQ
jgi:hypothetical protein